MGSAIDDEIRVLCKEFRQVGQQIKFRRTTRPAGTVCLGNGAFDASKTARGEHDEATGKYNVEPLTAILTSEFKCACNL